MVVGATAGLALLALGFVAAVLFWLGLDVAGALRRARLLLLQGARAGSGALALAFFFDADARDRRLGEAAVHLRVVETLSAAFPRSGDQRFLAHEEDVAAARGDREQDVRARDPREFFRAFGV